MTDKHDHRACFVVLKKLGGRPMDMECAGVRSFAAPKIANQKAQLLF